MKVSIIVGFSACAAQSAYAESAQVPILMAASKEPKALKDINVLNKCPDLTLGSPSAACKSAPVRHPHRHQLLRDLGKMIR